MPDKVYISYPIETDPSALRDDAITDYQQRVPGWEAAAADPLTIAFDETAEMAAEGRDLASDQPADGFMFFGAKLAGLPPIVGAHATVHATFTAIDDQGYTLDQGTVVGIPAAGDDLILFEVVDDYVIAPGDMETTDGGVTLQAQDPGSEANGLAGAGYVLEVVDTLPWIDGAVATDFTAGGADDEQISDYLDRLALELSLQSPRPILPGDFAALAETIPPVERALALDLYKPGPPYDPDPAATNVARCVTVVVVDSAGQPVPNRAAIADFLEGKREVNFLVFVIDPTYTQVDVTFEATHYDGFDTDDVNTRAVAALTAYLDPSAWGAPTGGEAKGWVNVDHAFYLEIATALNNVDGLDRVTALTIGKNGGAQSTTDVLLDGVAPLATAGIILGTVT